MYQKMRSTYIYIYPCISEFGEEARGGGGKLTQLENPLNDLNVGGFSKISHIRFL